MHDLVAKITENMEFWIFLYCGLSVILQSPAPCSGWGYWESKVRIVIHMAQEYYSFMLNRFFETLVILLTATKGIVERKQVDWFLSDWKQGLHSSHYLSHFPLHGRPEGKYEGPNSNNGVKADLGDGVHGPEEVLDKKVAVLTSHCSHTELWNGFWKPEHNL